LRTSVERSCWIFCTCCRALSTADLSARNVNILVKTFWSLIPYDTQTRSVLRTDHRNTAERAWCRASWAFNLPSVLAKESLLSMLARQGGSTRPIGKARLVDWEVQNVGFLPFGSSAAAVRIKYVRSLPGMGPILAAVVVSEIDGIERSPRLKALWLRRPVSFHPQQRGQNFSRQTVTTSQQMAPLAPSSRPLGLPSVARPTSGTSTNQAAEETAQEQDAGDVSPPRWQARSLHHHRAILDKPGYSMMSCSNNKLERDDDSKKSLPL
jgi:hypothetical protein